MSRARDMANLGSQAGSGLDASDITSGTLGNTVQDNITRLGVVTSGTFNNVIGSSATVPASVGSSLVLVKSVQGFAVNTTNDTSNGYVPDCFTSSYRDYWVFITGQIGTNEANLNCRLGTNDTINSTNDYLFNCRSTNALGNHHNFSGHPANYFGLLNGAKANGSENFDRFAISLYFHNPQAQYRTMWTGHSGHPRGGVSYINSYLSGVANFDAQFTDMSFYFHGNSGTGTLNFQSYGIKPS